MDTDEPGSAEKAMRVPGGGFILVKPRYKGMVVDFHCSCRGKDEKRVWSYRLG